MGSSASKPQTGLDRAAPIVVCMREKHGEDDEVTVDHWVKIGVSQRGSLSMVQLRLIEQKIDEMGSELKKKKKIKVGRLTELNRHRQVLKKWKEEAERRDNKQREAFKKKEEENRRKEKEIEELDQRNRERNCNTDTDTVCLSPKSPYPSLTAVRSSQQKRRDLLMEPGAAFPPPYNEEMDEEGDKQPKPGTSTVTAGPSKMTLRSEKNLSSQTKKEALSHRETVRRRWMTTPTLCVR